jgi:hypothetical protein
MYHHQQAGEVNHLRSPFCDEWVVMGGIAVMVDPEPFVAIQSATALAKYSPP